MLLRQFSAVTRVAVRSRVHVAGQAARASPVSAGASPMRGALLATRRSLATSAPTPGVIFNKDPAAARTVKEFVLEPVDSAVEPSSVAFPGISSRVFPKEVSDKLMQKIDPADVEIRPDGAIYLPEIKYRRILNAAIGPGAWALMPRPHTVICRGGSYSREFALFCFGNFVAQARGEGSGYMDKEEPNFGQLDESAKSNALMRCCKDIGIGSELWDPQYVQKWKDENAVEVVLENTTSGHKKRMWRKKEARPFGFPWRELGTAGTVFGTGSSSSAPAASSAPVAPPFVPAGPPFVPSGPPPPPPTAAADHPFDIHAIIPPSFKKYAGRTWNDLVSSTEGKDYLRFLLQKNPTAKHAEDIRQALAHEVTTAFAKDEA